jgi:hypothetical protein
MADSTRDEVRRLLTRYPANLARTRDAIDAALSGKPAPEPSPAELAAEVLAQYGVTADDIEQDIAEGGSVSALVFRDDEDPDRPLIAPPGGAS